MCCFNTKVKGPLVPVNKRYLVCEGQGAVDVQAVIPFQLQERVTQELLRWQRRARREKERGAWRRKRKTWGEAARQRDWGERGTQMGENAKAHLLFLHVHSFSLLMWHGSSTKTWGWAGASGGGWHGSRICCHFAGTEAATQHPSSSYLPLPSDLTLARTEKSGTTSRPIL